jgi:hypothetical protein
MLSIHIRLVLFPSGFLPKMYAFLAHNACYMPRLCHPPYFDLPYNISWEVQIVLLDSVGRAISVWYWCIHR